MGVLSLNLLDGDPAPKPQGWVGILPPSPRVGWGSCPPDPGLDEGPAMSPHTGLGAGAAVEAWGAAGELQHLQPLSLIVPPRLWG